MNREDKIKWVEDYLKTKEFYVDILNRNFIDAYIDKFNPKYGATNYGADKCPDVAKTLKIGFDQGIFKRQRAGITCGYSGMPRWVYVYSLSSKKGFRAK